MGMCAHRGENPAPTRSRGLGVKGCVCVCVPVNSASTEATGWEGKVRLQEVGKRRGGGGTFPGLSS